MPIRLNLLAEARAAEDMRRRDPVKRAIWVAALLISLMLVWSSSLQLKGMLANKDLGTVQDQMNSHTNEYQRVRDNQKKAGEIKFKLDALNRLATNRFLNGTLLNALQQNTDDDVQLVQLRVEQTYVQTQATTPTTNADRVLPGKPATVTEKIVLSLEGNDSSLNPGDQVNKFREILANAPYFRQMLGKTNDVTLKQQSATQVSPETGKACVLFTLEGQYQGKTR
jgi:DNA-binding PucR family transcriptional regulator